ncbi:MAG: response regulator transcription factor [Rhodocyclaceae bacterium]
MIKRAKRRVVVIDDNEMIRLTLRALLRAIGLDVVGEASNGRRGVQLVADTLPDLVCLDVVMPERDGLSILPDIWAATPGVKVLLITAHSDRETVSRAIELGVDGIIVKPFRQKQIHDEICRVIQCPDQRN